MPLVIVNHAVEFPETKLRELAATLPVIVAHVLDLPDEEIGHLDPADVEVRFHPYSTLDVTGSLQCVIDIQAIGFQQRVEHAHELTAAIRDRVATLGVKDFGVWLTLPAGGWAVG